VKQIWPSFNLDIVCLSDVTLLQKLYFYFIRIIKLKKWLPILAKFQYPTVLSNGLAFNPFILCKCNACSQLLSLRLNPAVPADPVACSNDQSDSSKESKRNLEKAQKRPHLHIRTSYPSSMIRRRIDRSCLATPHYVLHFDPMIRRLTQSGVASTDPCTRQCNLDLSSSIDLVAATGRPAPTVPPSLRLREVGHRHMVW
jgi:hypothetical protein